MWANAFWKCPHYVEWNVKIIFVKTGFCCNYLNIMFVKSKQEKIQSFLFIWLILMWMIL